MGIEIERRYLLDKLPEGSKKAYIIEQGYLSTDPKRTVRVRTMRGSNKVADAAWITIKSNMDNDSFTRYEYEYRIPVEEALELLHMCFSPVIKKTRYYWGDDGWEIDVFEEDFAGLIIAELELESEDQKFKVPEWATYEITGKGEYTNAGLVEGKQGENGRSVCW